MEKALNTLLDRWLPHADVLVVDDAAVPVVRARVRELGGGLSRELVETAALLASELAHNQLRHARGGRFAARLCERQGLRGIELLAADRGPGILDPAAAFADRNQPSGSLGAGLGAVLRLADEVDVDIRVGEGCCFRVRKLEESPRRRSEVGIYGRPHPDERIAGDDAAFARDGDVLALAVADGLGHGELARESSALIAERIELALRAPVLLVEEGDAAIAGTRGATLSVTRAHGDELEHAGVGDVATRLDRHGARTSRLGGQAGTLGVRRLSDVRVERLPVERGDVLIVTTDGVASSGDAVRLAHRHPVLLAHELVSRFGRKTDDALAAVALL